MAQKMLVSHDQSMFVLVLNNVANSSSLRDNPRIELKLQNRFDYIGSRLIGDVEQFLIQDLPDSAARLLEGDVGSMNGSTKLNRINNNNKHMNWHSLLPIYFPLYYHIIINARAPNAYLQLPQVTMVTSPPAEIPRQVQTESID